MGRPHDSSSGADGGGHGLDGRRRSLLAGIAGGAAASAGCVQRVRSIANRSSPDPVSLEIKAVPADVDRRAVYVARTVAENLQAVGVDARVTLMDEQELLRDVLINNEFDMYVARHPGYDDPDFLLSLLHSRFVEESGWQNPFGFTDLDVDDLLEGQRRASGDERRRQLAELQRTVARQQPFVVVAFPDDVWAVRSDDYAGWGRFNLGGPLGLLSLDAVGDDSGRLRTVVTDTRPTENLNPIASEFRSRGLFTGLLYDPLARRVDGSVEPWLARGWEWDDGDGAPTATVRLRDGARWHDGRPVTADDVAFTYELLADTSLGREESPVPAPRFRGRISLVERATPVDDRTVAFEFADSDPAVAARAFTVPVLPEREWASKSRPADVAGIDVTDYATEAVVWDNRRPVGSGPLAFEKLEPEERLVLSRFDDHFLHREDAEATPEFGAAFAELSVRVVPSDDAAVEFLASGRADATASTIDPRLTPETVRKRSVSLVSELSRSFYHLGFNVQHTPLDNPRFRRNVAQLVDKEDIVGEAFDWYAVPAANPLELTDWSVDDLEWDGADPEVPFFGSGGELNEARAREAFREAGYQYGNDDTLRR